MASWAANSIGSVPFEHLAALHHQLLQGRQSSASAQPGPVAESDTTSKDAANPTTITTTATTTTPSREASKTADPVLLQSAHAYRTPLSSPTRAHPHLVSAQSAPPSAMEALIQRSPSQQACRLLPHPVSFPGYPGGDTQPMESQIYRDYTVSMAAQSSTTLTTPQKEEKTKLYISPDGKCNTYDTMATAGKTPKTYVEGDSGFIDLANAWQQAVPEDARSTISDIEEFLASPSSQAPLPEVESESVMPKTPALAGHKRSRHGEILAPAPSTTKTSPAFSQLFAGGAASGPIMSATQLFDQTQAPSSPLLDAPRSDPILTRPSPNMDTRYTLSSPAAIVSSPIATVHSRPRSSAAGEPRGNYTNMRESQERRAARLREEYGLLALVEDDENDEASQQRRLAHMRRQRAASDHALGEWKKLRAPPRPGSRPNSSRKQPATIDLVTPFTEKKGQRIEFSISDDESDEDNNVPMNEDEDLPLPADDGTNHDDEQGDDDVYDELGQTVLRSQRDDQTYEPMNLASAEGSVVQKDVLDDGRRDDAVVACLSPTHLSGKAPRSTIRGEGRTVTATPSSAIENSQPGAQPQRVLMQSKHTNNHQLLSSFVPGSQYAGKTSQDQVHMRASGLRQSAGSQLQGSEKIPSSPPLMEVNNTVPEGSTAASLARRETLAQFQRPLQRNEVVTAMCEQEIPESDMLASDSIRPVTSHSTVAPHTAVHEDSNSVTLPLSTAQTHQAAPDGASPQRISNPNASQFSKHSTSMNTPLRIAGIRRFADIAADYSPPHASGETELDVDAIMGEIMTAEDMEFLEAVSSPVSEKAIKRRKLTRTASTKVASRMRSPKHVRQQDGHAVLVDAAMLPEEQPLISPLPGLTIAEADHAAPQPVRDLQNVPSNGEELLMSTPENAQLRRSTQESVKKREQAGALAVSQLLLARAAKHIKANKLANSGKNTLTMLNDGLVRRTVRREQKPNLSAAPPTKTAVKKRSAPKAITEIDEGQGNDRNALTSAVTAPESDADAPRRPSGGSTDPNTLAISAPERVLALFKGQYNNFYPATYLSTSIDGKSHKVKFDDDSIVNIDAQHVRLLDLRVGDQVKVDGVGMRKGVWIINSFANVARSDDQRSIGTDMHGYTIVKVQAKSSRNSLQANRLHLQVADEIVDVLVTNIYLTHTMWPAFADRQFSPPAAAKGDAGRLATPSTDLRTPDMETPASRSRRATLPPTNKTVARRTSHLREDSVASTVDATGSGIFTGMAFAISYGSNEAEKSEITRNIQHHGGLVLESGFEELFILPNLDENAMVPLPPSPDDGPALRLKPEYLDLSFVALIADRHSRRAKYMQALALNLPTLAGRWITDSLRATTTEPRPLLWAKYLLPSGESSYLSGAIRSRNLPTYPAAPARLADTIASREILLNGEGVLIVAAKKNKVTWERRKAYAFLTLALGAGAVMRVANLAEAKQLVDDGGRWKWVYVDGSVADASSALFGAGGAGGKNRKRMLDRGGSVAKIDAKAMSASSGDGRVKVVNDEFVVQSLILGALVD